MKRRSRFRNTASSWDGLYTVKSGAGPAGYTMIEPTYGTPGVSAGYNPLAMNDRGYGGNGSPMIDYGASGSGNELFTPGI